MKDLDITAGPWRATVPPPGGRAKIVANGTEIGEATGVQATQNAAIMAAAPALYDVLTDILLFLRSPENARPTPESTKEWSGIARRAQDIVGSLPKRV